MPPTDNQRIARNTILLYIRMAFVMIVQLFTSRIILEKLGQDAYGLYNVVGGLVVVMTFLNGAMVATSQRFLSYELGRKDLDRLRLTFSQCLYTHLFIAAIFIVIAETLGLWFLTDKMVIGESLRSQSIWVYQFAIASFVINLIQVPFSALITAHERLDVYAYLGMIDVCLRLATAFIIGKFATSTRLAYYSLLIFCVSFLINSIYIIFCRIKFAESKPIKTIDSKILKNLTSFFGWSMFGSAAWLAKNQGVNIVLNTFLGTAINAAYGIAMQINSAISSFAQNFIASVNPQLIQSYARKEYIRTNTLIQKGSRISFLLLFLIIFPVITSSKNILAIWLTEVPDYTNQFAQLVLIVTLLESFTYVMGTAIQATGRIRNYQIIIGLTLLLNLPASYMLLKWNFSPYTVLVGAIIIALVALIERIWIMHKCVEGFKAYEFIRDTILRCGTVATLTALTYRLIVLNIPNHHWLIDLFTAFIVALIAESALGLLPSERIKIVCFLKSKIRKSHG